MARNQSRKVTPLYDSPVPNSPIRDIAITERDAQLLVDLRRAPAMAIPRSSVSRYATAWAESLEGALSAYQSWAILCRSLLAEVPAGSDACNCGKREKFTISLEEFLDNSTLGNKAGKRKPCSRRPQSSVVIELVP